MITIETRYIGAGNVRGSRIAAFTTTAKPSTGKPERIVVPYDHALNAIDLHTNAASALARREGWEGEWLLVGETARGYLFTKHARPAFVVETTTEEA